MSKGLDKYLDRYTPVTVELINERDPDRDCAPLAVITRCRVNGRAERFVSVGGALDGPLEVTIEVGSDRVVVRDAKDPAGPGALLDGREHLVAEYGVRRDSIGRTRITLLADALRTVVEPVGARAAGDVE